MPIKHEFILKTIVRASPNVSPTPSITTDLDALTKEAITLPKGTDSRIEILVHKKGGVIITDSLDTEGKLTPLQEKLSINLHDEATQIIKRLTDDSGKIKIKFIVRKN